MVNVNKGRSEDLLQACQPLMEYAWIVDMIRELEPGRELIDAIDEAIDAIPQSFVTKEPLINSAAHLAAPFPPDKPANFLTYLQ